MLIFFSSGVWSLSPVYLLESISCLSPGVYLLFISWSLVVLESVPLIERFPKLVGVQVSAGAGVGAGCPQFSGFHRDLLTVHFSPALLTRPEIQV